MPTISPRSASPSPLEPHRARQTAESFGADPERYDRTRPRYPQALVDRIIAASPGRDVLDVGLGTGVSARPFQTAGCRVLGVEVDARMAKFAKEQGFDVEIAKFEEWDAAGRMFDAIIAGQTWHWVDPQRGAAKAAELLRRGGRLAVFWNVQQPPPELAQAFSEVYRRLLPNTPFVASASNPLDAYDRIRATAADAIQATGAFHHLEQWRFDWEQSYTKDQWLEQVPTFGGHSQFPPAKLDELLAGIGAAIDVIGDGFTMKYATVAVTAATNATPHGESARRPPPPAAERNTGQSGRLRTAPSATAKQDRARQP